VRVLSNRTGRGTFGCLIWYTAVVIAAAAVKGACELKGVDIIVILYFKARCLKYNILKFYLDNSKLNVKLI